MIRWVPGQNFVISFSSPCQFFQVFPTKFHIRFRRLVLLKKNFFEKIFKTGLQKFALCPLVTRTSGGFRLNSFM